MSPHTSIPSADRQRKATTLRAQDCPNRPRATGDVGSGAQQMNVFYHLRSMTGRPDRTITTAFVLTMIGWTGVWAEALGICHVLPMWAVAGFFYTGLVLVAAHQKRAFRIPPISRRQHPVRSKLRGTPEDRP